MKTTNNNTTTTKTTIATLKNAFQQTELQLASISYNRMVIIAVLTLGKFNNVELKEKALSQKQVTELLSISKSYVSQAVKVARFIAENNVYQLLEENKEKFDLAKMYKASNKTLEDFVKAFNLKRKASKQENKQEDKTSTKSEKPIEKGSYITIQDKNGMVDIHHDGKHYCIPLDILNNYLVK